MGKLLFVLAVAAILGGCYIKGCPQGFDDYGPWVSSLTGYCGRGLVTALRESMDDCEAKSANMATCMMDEMMACTTDHEYPDYGDYPDGGYDGDYVIDLPTGWPFNETDWMDYSFNDSYWGVGMNFSTSVSYEAQNMSDTYNGLFCGNPEPMEHGPEVYIPQCENEQLYTDANMLACSTDFLAAFNADRLDDSLCELYYTMSTCQTAQAEILCPSVDAAIIDQDEEERNNMNFFCTGGEHGIGDDENSNSFGGGNGDGDGTDGDGDGTDGDGTDGDGDGEDSGSSGMPSLFAYGLGLLFVWITA